MKQFFFYFLFFISISASSKEWKSLPQYKEETNKNILSEKDWLHSDRKQNTLIWQQANSYNLQNNFPEEYQTIKQRTDFYQWYYTEIDQKGHEVVWPKMAHFISNKLRLVKVFPYSLFITKNVKIYSYQGSETVFNNAFLDMNALYLSEAILKGEVAIHWDERMLYKEQFEWIEEIYKDMDANSLKTIERMAKGKGFYSIMLAKEIRLQGDISKASERYEYAMYVLRAYCKKWYE
ncbi:MAG: Insecticidal toxin complex protein [Oceanihabitans sp.]|nr:Insecticidal toxin complex protein [Oceanihabitans sp.]